MIIQKVLLMESKGPDIDDEESVMTGSTPSTGSYTECQTTSKGLSSKRINVKKFSVSEKPTAAVPLSPLLRSDDKSVTFVPPPPPLPPPPIGPNLQIKSLAAAKPTTPPSRVEISQTAISEQLKLLKKPVMKVNKKTCPANPFSLNEILATRRKLRAVSSDTKQRGKFDTPMDLSSILKESLKNIRDMTEYSDKESDSDPDFE